MFEDSDSFLSDFSPQWKDQEPQNFDLFSPVSNIELGKLLRNRYRVDQRLDEGGMGEVFLATDTLMKQKVAIKVAFSDNSLHLYRIKREYQFLKAVDHPALVKAIDFFENDEQAFLVLEYIQGETLETILKQREKLSVIETLGIAIHIAWAIGSLHDIGIIHRDIKPANIIVDFTTQTVKLLDLGVGKKMTGVDALRAHQMSQTDLTKSGNAVGTISYISPEQLQGNPCLQSDIFSLGVVLYQMLLWQPNSPFQQANFYETALQVMQYELPKLQETKDEVENDPRWLELDQLITRLVAKNPSHRLSSMEDFISLCSSIQKKFFVENSSTNTGFAIPPVKILRLPDVFLSSSEKKITNSLPDQFGPYKILEEIGRGGMGVVYKAQQEGVKRLVALKVLKPNAAGSDMKRFLREAKAGANLKHPNIIPVYHVGKEGRRAYIAMRYVEGTTFDVWMQSASQEEKLQAIQKVSQALHYAHQQKVIHRDIKPSNILMDQDGTPFLGDFGLATILNQSKSLTSDHAVMGTLQYCAPEQLQGRTRNKKADIYSLGVILYQSLTGELPHAGQNPLEIYKSSLYEKVNPPSHHCKNIPKDLENLCLKAMERQVSRRLRSAGEMARQIDFFLRGKKMRALSNLPVAWLIPATTVILVLVYFYIPKEISPKDLPPVVESYQSLLKKAESENDQSGDTNTYRIKALEKLRNELQTGNFLQEDLHELSLQTLLQIKRAGYFQDAKNHILLFLKVTPKGDFREKLIRYLFFFCLDTYDYQDSIKYFAEMKDKDLPSYLGILHAQAHMDKSHEIKNFIPKIKQLATTKAEKKLVHFQVTQHRWRKLQSSLNSWYWLFPSVDTRVSNKRRKPILQWQNDYQKRYAVTKNIWGKQEISLSDTLVEESHFFQNIIQAEIQKTLPSELPNKITSWREMPIANQILYWQTLIRLCLYHKSWELACHNTQEAISLFPWQSAFYQLQSFSLYHLDRLEEAETASIHAATIDTNNITARSSLIKLMQQDLSHKEFLINVRLLEHEFRMQHDPEKMFFEDYLQELYLQHWSSFQSNFDEEKLTQDWLEARTQRAVFEKRSRKETSNIQLQTFKIKENTFKVKLEKIQKKKMYRILVRYANLKDKVSIDQAYQLMLRHQQQSLKQNNLLIDIIKDQEVLPILRLFAARMLTEFALWKYIVTLENFCQEENSSLNILAMAALQNKRVTKNHLQLEKIHPLLEKKESFFYYLLVLTYASPFQLRKIFEDTIAGKFYSPELTLRQRNLLQLAACYNLVSYRSQDVPMYGVCIQKHLEDMTSPLYPLALRITWHTSSYPQGFEHWHYQSNLEMSSMRYQEIWPRYHRNLLKACQSESQMVRLAALRSIVSSPIPFSKYLGELRSQGKFTKVFEEFSQTLWQRIQEPSTPEKEQIISVLALATINPSGKIWSLVRDRSLSFMIRGVALFAALEKITDEKNFLNPLRQGVTSMKKLSGTKTASQSDLSLRSILVMYLGYLNSYISVKQSRDERNLAGLFRKAYQSIVGQVFEEVKRERPELHKAYIVSLLWNNQAKDIDYLKQKWQETSDENTLCAIAGSMAYLIVKYQPEKIFSYQALINTKSEKIKTAAATGIHLGLRDHIAAHTARYSYQNYLGAIRTASPEQRNVWLKHLEYANSFSTNFQIEYEIAYIKCYQNESIQEIVSHLERAKKLLPSYTTDFQRRCFQAKYYSLLINRNLRNQTREAWRNVEEYYEKVIQAYPQEMTLHHEIPGYWLGQKNFQQAQRFYQNFFILEKRLHTFTTISKMILHQGREKDSIDLLASGHKEIFFLDRYDIQAHFPNRRAFRHIFETDWYKGLIEKR